jgi:glycosyltransferase involved in cell wall biosynthesis
LRRSITADQHSLVVTFGSNLRDTLRVIESFHQMIEVPDIKFLILGKLGPTDLARIQKMPVSLVEATGYLEEAEVYRYLCCSDCFLMTFQKLDSERGLRAGASTKSGSLAAAFASGLPVITHKGFLTDSVFKDGENCYFLKNENDDMVQEIINVVNDKQLLQKLREGAELYYMDFISWQVIAERFIRIFERA